MGVTFASFHIKGTLPEVREKLNRSLRGKERGLESYFNTRLLIASGPVALPNCRDFNMVATSKGEDERKLRLFSGRVISGGVMVCVFIKFSLCYKEIIHQGCFIILFGVHNIVFI